MVVGLQCAGKGASVFWIQDPNRDEENKDVFGYVTTEVGCLIELDFGASFERRVSRDGGADTASTDVETSLSNLGRVRSEGV